MQAWQYVLIGYLIVACIFFLKGLYECKDKHNAFGETPLLGLIGAFVWADAVVFGPFWILVSLIVLYTSDVILFFLILSIFWTIRSLGEMIYWFNQQFSTIQRNPPKKFYIYSIFKNDSVWFVYQIFWQCIGVLSIVSSLYFAHLWLVGLS